jgi:hypothetical protein
MHAHRIVRLKDGVVESDNENKTITSFASRMEGFN